MFTGAIAAAEPAELSDEALCARLTASEASAALGSERTAAPAAPASTTRRVERANVAANPGPSPDAERSDRRGNAAVARGTANTANGSR